MALLLRNQLVAYQISIKYSHDQFDRICIIRVSIDSGNVIWSFIICDFGTPTFICQIIVFVITIEITYEWENYCVILGLNDATKIPMTKINIFEYQVRYA